MPQWRSNGAGGMRSARSLFLRADSRFLPPHRLFSYFAIVSAQIGLGYGSYPPITWPEALVWVFIMLIVAGMWAILGGLIVSFIMASSIGRQEYKASATGRRT